MCQRVPSTGSVPAKLRLVQVDHVGEEGEEEQEEGQGVGEGPAEEGRGGFVVDGCGMEEHLQEGEVGDEEEKTGDGVEREDFSSFSEQLLHVDPAPLCLREPSWHLGQNGGVYGVANRDE